MHLLERTRHQTAGYILVTDTVSGKTLEEFDVARCCHCQLIWRIRPGSGVVRGWCTLCSEPTCGRMACQSCVPFERRLMLDHARTQLLQALGRV